MQDRFKFRIWDKIHNRFLCIDNQKRIIFDYEDKEIRILEDEENAYWLHIPCDECIILQCTGLKDKNGKLIYEADILKDKYGALHPISWNVKGFYEADTFAVAGFYNAIQEDMEVIGNIYEKELLEE